MSATSAVPLSKILKAFGLISLSGERPLLMIIPLTVSSTATTVWIPRRA